MAETPNIANPRCLVIGPKGCGKTSLVAALKIAALKETDLIPGVEETSLTFKMLDEDTLNFFQLATRNIMMTGSFAIEASQTNIGYTFEMEMSYSTQGWIGRKNFKIRQDFTMFDTKGESVFLRESPELDLEIIKTARYYQSLIILVDSQEVEGVRELSIYLPSFLNRLSNNFGRFIPFERIAISLTKADKYVSQAGVRAEDMLKSEQYNPVSYAVDVLGKDMLREIGSYLMPKYRKNVAVGWSSIFGFIPHDGSVNVVKDAQYGQRLAVFREEPKWKNDWRPYGVVDPFVYAASGLLMGMKPIPEKLLGIV